MQAYDVCSKVFAVGAPPRGGIALGLDRLVPTTVCGNRRDDVAETLDAHSAPVRA